jgi:hypothetical protein
MASIGIHGAGASGGGGGATDATIVAPIGQDTMDNSVSVVIASDQSAVPVDATIVNPFGQDTMANSIPVVLASDHSSISTIIPPISDTTTLSGVGNVSLTLDGHTGVGVWLDPNASFAGTVLVEATTDNVTWFFVRFVKVAFGNVAEGVTYVGGLDNGIGDQHLSAILPSGVNAVRARVSAYTAGSITIIIVASSSQEFTPPYVGANAVTPNPTAGLQLGGAASVGGQFNTVRVSSTHAGLSDQGLVVRPVGMMLTAGSSAGSLQTTLVGGRDPETNALRQLDLLAKNINSSGYQRLIVQAYPTTDGTTLMPLMAAHASRGFVEPTKATAGSAPAAATVGVTSAQAVAANSSRKGLILTNTSPNIISLSFDAAAVLYSGITLMPGATFSMDENSFDAGEVRAIASVASSNLSIQEFT